jgi:hypothetical protein
MTNFIYPTYIFNKDIKIRPEVLIDKIYKLINKEINDLTSEDIASQIKLKYIKSIYKEIKQMFTNYHFWKEVCSYNFCSYQFRNPKDENDKGKMCGRRIDKKLSYDSQSEKFFCSEHDRNHRKNHSKPIQIKDNEIYCNHINRDGTNCKHISKINGICMKHYKLTYKINKEEIYNKIIFYKSYTDIILEINLLSNIEIENPFHCGNNKKNVDQNIKKVRFRTQCQDFQQFDRNEINNDNSNIIKIAKNKKSLENFNISNSIINVYNNLEELNINITENEKILEKLKKFNKQAFHRNCEAYNCTNGKYYNIINRPIQPITNLFYQRKHNSYNITSTTFTNNNFNNS